jgi:hypothetical protein
MNIRYLSPLLSVLLLLASFLGGTEVELTCPPKGWECIRDPEQLPQKVKLIYIGNPSGKSVFNPSLNIACETTSLSLSEYLVEAKIYHEGQGGTTCHSLGKIATLAGEAHLLQIDRPSQWGDVRFLQGIFIREGNAYVITATCLKNEFNLYSTSLFKAIQSVTLK